MEKNNSNWGFENHLKLFAIFFKIGLLTIGGGLVMIPVMHREFVENCKWIDNEKMVDIFSIAQSVPGVIAVNSSIYIGYELGGLPGAITAAVGVSLPSFICILVIYFALKNIGENIYLTNFYRGVRAAVIALIAIAAIKLGKSAVQDKFGVFVTLFGIAVTILLGFDIATVVVISGFMGYSYYCIYPALKERRKNGS